MPQALLKITGKVQGVWYRSSAREKARELGLTGYAKNLSDGAVEALVQGKKPAIEAFVKWAAAGPDLARVENIKIEWQEKDEPKQGFTID